MNDLGKKLKRRTSGRRASWMAGGLALAGCSITTVPLPLSPADFDHIDSDLVGLWQGVGYMDDRIFPDTEFVALKVIPTRDGADIVAMRSGSDGTSWAVGRVSTTVFADQRYASIELTHKSSSGAWSPLEEGDILVARYSLRAPGIVDLFYITNEGSSRLRNYENAWLADASSAEAAEIADSERLSAVLDQATAAGRAVDQDDIDSHGAMMALLETEDGANFFSGYYGTFARLDDVTIPRLPDALTTESDTNVAPESAGPATSEGQARRDAP